MDIQVDMFEVQLGAALLLQFGVDGRTVRVLADAGTSKSGYDSDHVLNKLKEVLPIDDPEQPPRIDLLIGTHYDMDHLNRMVPVIRSYEIGEAWLPPIANDANPRAADWDRPRGGNLLGVQFAGEDGDEALHRYLQHKADVLQDVSHIRRSIEAGDSRLTASDFAFRSSISRVDRQEPLHAEAADKFFGSALASCALALGETADHACTDVRLPVDIGQILDYEEYEGDARFLTSSWMTAGAHQARSLAYIERSIAKDALTASSLKKVVEALVAKDVSMRYESVDDGQPSYFVWDAVKRRFVSTAALDAERLTMTLLGPSDGLIAKYWDRLPVGDYVQFALASRMPVEKITPQNELSYAIVFHHKEQGILVSGDTGFVDFAPLDARPSTAVFYPDLIDALRVPLNVVQVAHHGGHNKYFYHVLQAADFPIDESDSYLLLSHEVKATSRPSKVFAQFMTELGDKASQVSLLFTSQPLRSSVRDYSDRIAPVVPDSDREECGDVRLSYAGGQWTIQKHAVKP
ncbi:hypothetical protein H0E84_03315 [Luteimonas sp. SJ-92]|uniref:Uncharacterized protein n=1 Tax=Luteimonas salinisoli TaxID=2752307 RepID=A0A853J9T0_9GAMM|nr:hypothetical protein [Luteimonas salinisoli]NZA25400.1 hypothetical protein [Luteimonas salinisoli]